MLKNSLGILALLALIFAFIISSLLGPKPVNADPDITRVRKSECLATVYPLVRVDEKAADMTTTHSVSECRLLNVLYFHDVTAIRFRSKYRNV